MLKLINFTTCLVATAIGSASEGTSISGFNPNYLLIGKDTIVTNSSPDRSLDDCDIKFQISFSRRLKAPTMIGEFFTDRTPLYFGFTQEAYWDICGSSSPFRETNYRPTLFYRIGDEMNYLIGYEHESNGRDGDESRSWDRLYLRYRTPLSVSASNTNIRTSDQSKWTLDATAWLPFSIGGETEGIEDYAGYGEVAITYTPNSKLRTRLTLRKGGNLNEWHRGLGELDVIFTLPWLEVQGFVQYTNGYGASIERFDQHEYSLRAGVLFSDFNAF